MDEAITLNEGARLEDADVHGGILIRGSNVVIKNVTVTSK